MDITQNDRESLIETAKAGLTDLAERMVDSLRRAAAEQLEGLIRGLEGLDRLGQPPPVGAPRVAGGASDAVFVTTFALSPGVNGRERGEKVPINHMELAMHEIGHRIDMTSGAMSFHDDSRAHLEVGKRYRVFVIVEATEA